MVHVDTVWGSLGQRASGCTERKDSCATGKPLLLGDLATVTRNTMAMNAQPNATFTLYPQLTSVQVRAFQLLDVAVNL
jgi:hypothetical protein